MSLDIILKNSSVPNKEPTAAQITTGEITLNYHATAPFLACKDTAGNIRRIGHAIGTTAGTAAAGDDARFHESVSLAASVTDIFNLTGQSLSADDPGADRLVFWDDSASKLTHLALGSGLTISGTTLSVTATGTDLGYTAATRVLTSSTGTDVTLPVFTSAAPGLVPESGGGTANFLRADGLWAAPSSGGDGTGVLTDGDKGDITVSASGATWTIDAGAVTYAKIQDVSQTDVILGRFSSGAGDIEEITCTSTGRSWLAASSASSQRTLLGLGGAATLEVGTSAGTVAAGDDSRFHTAVTLDATVSDVLGLSTQALSATDPNADRLLFWDDSAGKLRHLTLGANLTITDTTLSASPGAANVPDGDKGDVVVTNDGGTWTIASGVVTYAKIQNVSSSDRLLGRQTAGSGSVEEIVCTAAGRALLDDANAAAQRTTLGLGSVATLTAPDGDLVGTSATQTLTGKTLGALKETVHTISDGAGAELRPSNGPIQVWTLGANRSPSASNFAAGESMMLMVADGSGFTITWPSVTWVGGTAPTLATSGYTVIELWKVSSTLYGATVGNVA